MLPRFFSVCTLIALLAALSSLLLSKPGEIPAAASIDPAKP